MRAALDAPIACTLPTAALSERLTWIRQVTERHLMSHHLDERALTLTYQPGAKAELERIVAGEQDCCSFLEFNLDGGPATVVLTIRAPEGLEGDARWLFDEFLPRAVPSRRCGCAPGACG